MTLAAMTALRAEHVHASGLIASLAPAEWQTMSACAGWRVQDVVQHMASVFHKVADPDTIERGTSWDAEANAEVPVQARRAWTTQQVADEYTEWSAKALDVLAERQREPLASTIVDLGNVGRHPLHIYANALVFDHYCHLRHDIGPVVGRAAELPRDPEALGAALEWMLAGLPQMCFADLGLCSQGVNLCFDGPGARTFALRPGERGESWLVLPGAAPDLPNAETTMHDFVSWGTKRTNWRDYGISLTAEAARTLDAINVI
jgi:hypothetical protein